MSNKNLVVLARRDHAEAMRVAAGLTIAGHGVRLIFMRGPVEESAENIEQAETLELCDIEPETTVPGQEIQYIDSAGLSLALLKADSVINL
ncbi:hypothetical protein [Sedimenticola selenatireducens]|jgi:hypothetical protein|uniref:Uncharacterized protein n=1 Tax=Sedimenticola selenatireducens TaxID=191960 RepID=A0A557SET6_9GAMM|nr:hypothetical protein [Sedimenticola selenatireducens]TVO75881.1 hypothetical protein FHP88_07735 [Sedimenticola selenatireducens]TVT63740.1 MAG: hypothetical protein FHK78_10435 [Sedimenticola selenatireducens]